MTDYEYIRDKVPGDELLCQLMEECGELSAAANHLRRARNEVNPTPKDLMDATVEFEEEIADVLTVLNAIGDYTTAVNINVRIISEIKFKAERWKQRLMEHDVKAE